MHVSSKSLNMFGYRRDASTDSDSLDGSNAYLAAAGADVAPRASLFDAQLYAIVAASTSTSPRENCGESCAPKNKYVPTQLTKMAIEVANCRAARERHVRYGAGGSSGVRGYTATWLPNG